MYNCNKIVTFEYWNIINHLVKEMEEQLGTGYVIEVDTVTALTANRGTEANYKIIACLTSNGFDGTTAAQSTDNKCNGRYSSSKPGVLSWSMSFEGVVVSLVAGEAATRANAQEIATIWKDGKTCFWRWTNAAGEFVREGKAWISAYNESAPNNEAYTFTGTLTGVGEPFLTPATP